MLRRFIVGLFVGLFLPITSAWGPIGHSTIAEIAQQLISPSTDAAIKPLLSKYDGNMSQAANWADEVRTLPEFKWSEPLHFINTPDWNCSYIRQRDCFNEANQYGFCVDGAIQNYTYILQTRSCKTDTTLLEEAIKFMIHFYGDIHQPLHCGFSSDRGGNDIKGHYFHHSTNLHAIWDSGLIETRINSDFGGSVWGWQQYLLNLVPKIYNLYHPDSQQWGDDSVKLACNFAYVNVDSTHITQDFQLGQDYYLRNIAIVEHQIIQAAVRLKIDLDVIFN